MGGGGVAMYLKNNGPFVERKDDIIPNLEAVWTEVKLCIIKSWLVLSIFTLDLMIRTW